MNSSLWYREIMSLKIPNLLHKDLSKILLLFYLIKVNGFNKKNYILDFNEYVYRFYIDNFELAKLHPSVIVNNISHYGTKDLFPFTKQAIEDWKNEFKNGCLQYDNVYFWVDLDDLNEDVINNTKNIANMLYMKATNKQFNYNEDMEKIFTYDLDMINNSLLKNRVLEDMQYCVCCDEIKDLKIINISNNIAYINNKYNYVTVCSCHYNLFKMGYFNFNKNGYINIKKMI